MTTKHDKRTIFGSAEQNNLDGQVAAISEVAKTAGEVWAPVVAGIGIADD